MTHTAVCPNCRVIRNVHASIEREKIPGHSGSVVTVEIVTVHCESCGSFVSRQTRELSDDLLLGMEGGNAREGS